MMERQPINFRADNTKAARLVSFAAHRAPVFKMPDCDSVAAYIYNDSNSALILEMYIGGSNALREHLLFDHASGTFSLRTQALTK